MHVKRKLFEIIRKIRIVLHKLFYAYIVIQQKHSKDRYLLVVVLSFSEKCLIRFYGKPFECNTFIA